MSQKSLVSTRPQKIQPFFQQLLSSSLVAQRNNWLWYYDVDLQTWCWKLHWNRCGRSRVIGSWMPLSRSFAFFSILLQQPNISTGGIRNSPTITNIQNLLSQVPRYNHVFLINHFLVIWLIWRTINETICLHVGSKLFRQRPKSCKKLIIKQGNQGRSGNKDSHATSRDSLKAPNDGALTMRFGRLFHGPGSLTE